MEQPKLVISKNAEEDYVDELVTFARDKGLTKTIWKRLSSLVEQSFNDNATLPAMQSGGFTYKKSQH